MNAASFQNQARRFPGLLILQQRVMLCRRYYCHSVLRGESLRAENVPLLIFHFFTLEISKNSIHTMACGGLSRAAMLLGQQLLILLVTRAPGEKNHKLLLSKMHFFLEGKVSFL